MYSHTLVQLRSFLRFNILSMHWYTARWVRTGSRFVPKNRTFWQQVWYRTVNQIWISSGSVLDQFWISSGSVLQKQPWGVHFIQVWCRYMRTDLIMSWCYWFSSDATDSVPMLLIQFWCYWFSSENIAITELFGNGSVLCQNQCCFSSMFGLIWLRTSLCNFNTIVTMFKWNTSCFQHVAHVRQNLYIIYEVLKY